jgi:hypothetical protein
VGWCNNYFFSLLGDLVVGHLELGEWDGAMIILSLLGDLIVGHFELGE